MPVGYRCALEPQVPNANDKKKRGDIRTIERGVVTIMDFSGIAPQRADTLQKAAKEVGAAAKFAAKGKRDMYEADCKKIGFKFIPLIMEEDGLFHEDFLGLIRECAKRAKGPRLWGP